MAYYEIQCLQDTYVLSSYPANNYGNGSFLSTDDAATSSYSAYSLLKFDLSNIGSNLYIHSAKLRLQCTAYANPNIISKINIYRITSSWNESTVTWNTQPTIDSTILAQADVRINGTYRWDITDVVRGWHTGLYQNYGVELRPDIRKDSQSKSFASRENSDISIRPVLEVIVYTKDLIFIDPSDAVNFTDDKGNIGKQLDFAQIVAGNISNIKAIDLYNYNAFGVSNPIVYLENLPSGDTIEISKFNDPFIPSPEVHFDGTFASGTKIGTFYVRVKPGEDSSGSKSFRIHASGIPVE